MLRLRGHATHKPFSLVRLLKLALVFQDITFRSLPLRFRSFTSPLLSCSLRSHLPNHIHSVVPTIPSDRFQRTTTSQGSHDEAGRSGFLLSTHPQCPLRHPSHRLFRQTSEEMSHLKVTSFLPPTPVSICKPLEHTRHHPWFPSDLPLHLTPHQANFDKGRHSSKGTTYPNLPFSFPFPSWSSHAVCLTSRPSSCFTTAAARGACSDTPSLAPALTARLKLGLDRIWQMCAHLPCCLHSPPLLSRRHPAPLLWPCQNYIRLAEDVSSILERIPHRIETYDGETVEVIDPKSNLHITTPVLTAPDLQPSRDGGRTSSTLIRTGRTCTAGCP